MPHISQREQQEHNGREREVDMHTKHTQASAAAAEGQFPANQERQIFLLSLAICKDASASLQFPFSICRRY
jgi:hypothetical protein